MQQQFNDPDVVVEKVIEFKVYLEGQLRAHNMALMTQDVLDSINKILLDKK
jgi:hypothetical protein